jgi:tetratricopeptide (TPR) repeat protein
LSQAEYRSQIERIRRLINQGELEEAENILSRLEETFQSVSVEKEMVIDILNEKGKLHFRRGNYKAAKQLLEKALVKARESEPYEFGEATAIHYIGATMWNLGEADGALELYEQALSIRRKIGDERGAAASIHNIAMCQSKRGNIQKAFLLYNEALEIKSMLKDNVGVVRTLSNIGAIYRRMGDFSKAMQYLRQAQELAQEIGLKQGEILVDHNMGVISWAQGNIDDAKKRLVNCATYWHQKNIQNTLLASVLRDLAEMGAELGEFNEAEEHLAKLNEMAARFSSSIISCYASYSNGTVAKAKGNVASALKAFKNSLFLAQRHKMFELELKSLVQLAEMHLFEFRLTMDEENLEKTQEYINEAKTASKELNHAYALIESSIVNGMLMAAGMDFHAAEAELTQAVLTSKEQNLPIQEKKAETQLAKVKKLHARADRMIRPPEMEEQVEEIKSYLNKYAKALKGL